MPSRATVVVVGGNIRIGNVMDDWDRMFIGTVVGGVISGILLGPIGAAVGGLFGAVIALNKGKMR